VVKSFAWLRMRPKTLASAGVTAAAVAVAGMAFAYEGNPTAEVDLHDGGVWLTKTSSLMVGHFNNESRVLDGGLRTGGENYDVLQSGGTVLVDDRSASTLTSVDPARVVLSDAVLIRRREVGARRHHRRDPRSQGGQALGARSLVAERVQARGHEALRRPSAPEPTSRWARTAPSTPSPPRTAASSPCTWTGRATRSRRPPRRSSSPRTPAHDHRRRRPPWCSTPTRTVFAAGHRTELDGSEVKNLDAAVLQQPSAENGSAVWPPPTR
jgi:hypothetical protein